MVRHVEIREMGESHGVGTFALKSFGTGDVVMEEIPLVFSQSIASQNGPEGVQCCRGCGMILTTLGAECERLARLFQAMVRRQHCMENDCDALPTTCLTHVVGDTNHVEFKEAEMAEVISSPHALQEIMGEFSASDFFCCGASDDDVGGGGDDDNTEKLSPGREPLRGARFCSQRCKQRFLHERGGRFLLFATTVVSGAAGAPATIKTLPPHNLQKPTAITIMCLAATLDVVTVDAAWSSRSHVLETLEYLADSFNERLRLILSLLAQCLNDALQDASVSAKQLQSRFAAKVHEFVLRFAEGAARPLTEQQRAFLRFSWKCVSRWLDFCCLETPGVVGVPEPFQWLPLQLYLRCFWLTDANVHMFVVVSPLYSLLCQQLPTLQAKCRRNGDGGELLSTQLGRKMGILRELFRVVEPTAAHATGVALYDAATKINHSCAPSVRFVPTHGGVRAVVVALRDIEQGEEIRSSYIDVSAHASRAERQEYLLSHYGFSCDCPRCCRA
ncbi:hypothetical protein TraAM80_08300 [Trypanosoma rangeli]|uniref:SET domain-containing protein n=1 Tax=Trypanosoma rangeli TaxID=5698 RepID=A0A3R7RB97_TRYRA|nr:uncharacterized protein TraAM80_08300 [Trypanosoma rangeli]RNE99227.1 hypothetical protein TraAM80_08300 [Trypanosoma rangeli]|eukprot:RNE99227.1 hypothetical protein TraAM80_08300 [Trypanosoma rangeli]